MNSIKFDINLYAERARLTAAEGVVLLKNDGDVLPLKQGSRTALFGRTQFNYYKSGTGSGGLVNSKKLPGFTDVIGGEGGLVLNKTVKERYAEWLKSHPFISGVGWGGEPWFQEEMPIDAELAEQAANESEAAVIIIGRTAGEDQDNKAERGSYLLTTEEENMLKTVCAAFEHTVVLLNTGNIIDMKWVKKYNPSAVLYLWQGGREGIGAALDVLTGKVNPSGRLSDTIAYDITDYPSTANHGSVHRNIYAEDIYVGYRYFETFAPERVMYPFGYGLSYTEFKKTSESIEHRDNKVLIRTVIANIGNISGKHVLQAYCKAPQGKLGKPARILIGFTKTKELKPSQEQALIIEVDYSQLASYDDTGITGYKSAWVLEAGEYCFYTGDNVREADYIGSILIDEIKIIEQLCEASAPTLTFERIIPGYEGELARETVPKRTINPAWRREQSLPPEFPYTGDKGYKLADVKNGRITIQEFAAQLSDDDLCCLVRGEGMSSPKVTPGTAGAFGGVTERLNRFGIPVACCADGPSGIRMDCGTEAFSLPNGTCIACTFNEELTKELFEFEGLELRKNKIDTLLAPGINIHRNPLNGRNFEYFSEDPLLTGKMAVAELNGLHKYGVTGTIKHFACNSQEAERTNVEAIVSERALREIYLRAFETAVKDGGAKSIMTSYNPINGFWSASNRDLLIEILRNEWGYTGIVMTDWWAKGNDEDGVASDKNTAAMVRSGNDLYMVVTNAEINSGCDNSAEGLKAGKVTRGEFLRSAKNICLFLAETPAFKRLMGEFDRIDEALASLKEDQDNEPVEVITVTLGDRLSVGGEIFDTARGQGTYLTAITDKPGVYKAELVCRAIDGVSALAQIPVSFFHNSCFIKTITLTGADTVFRTVTIHEALPIRHCSAHFKFVFGQSGMEISEFIMTRIKDLPAAT